MENEVKTNNYHCYILPWLNLKEEIHIGAVTFKRFDPKNLDDGSNQELIESLKKSLEHFVKWNGKPTDQAVVCFYKNQWIYDQNFRGKQNIREAVDILTFLVISRLNVLCFCGNEYMGQPASAEKFKLATVPVLKDANTNHEVFNKAGVVTICSDVDKFYFDLEPTKHGYRELTKNQYNSELLELFKHLIASARNEEVEKIFRAVTWFRYSQTESTEIDPFSCILMKMTAFEILLNLPDRDTRFKFMEHIDKDYVNKASNDNPLENFIMEKRTIKRGQSETRFNQSKLAWWAYDIYGLRSRIVHGEHLESKDMKRDDQKYNELIIADIVFSWLVTEKLMRLYCPIIDENDIKKMIERSFYEISLRNLFFDAFKKAGWIVRNKEADQPGPYPEIQ